MKLSQDGATVLVQGNSEKMNLKYPAVTVCPKVSTKYSIAERLGNLIDPMNLPEELLSLRQDFFMCAARFTKKRDGWESNFSYKRLFDMQCSGSYSFGCEVHISAI